MERADIMINDWVYMSDKSLYAMQVVMIDGYNCGLDFPGNEADYFDGIYGENGIAPIPLTEAMLKRNGWKKSEAAGGTYYLREELVFLEWIAANKACLANEGLFPYPVQYVHQLQHILRVCGLDVKADNFKIK